MNNSSIHVVMINDYTNVSEKGDVTLEELQDKLELMYPMWMVLAEVNKGSERSWSRLSFRNRLWKEETISCRHMSMMY